MRTSETRPSGSAPPSIPRCADVAPSRRLPRSFYATDPISLAKALIGKHLVRVLDDGTALSGMIVETEAYLGVEDRAAHTFGGRRTQRNEAMYGRAGTAYVYFTYGMHHCMNVVCGEVDEPVAVLLRALEPLTGVPTMRKLRAGVARKAPLRDHDLCRGPGRLCQALGIDRGQNAADLVAGDQLFIVGETRAGLGQGRLACGPRIGVQGAGNWADRPLRWCLIGSRHVSVRMVKARSAPGRSR